MAAAHGKSNQTSNQDSNSWLFQCPPGLANIFKKEMIYAGLIERKQQLFFNKQRNHDLVFVNRLKSDEGLSKLRIAESVLKCPVFGRFKVSKNQLQRMADELKLVGPRRLVVSVAGRHFQRHDFSRYLAREMSARGYEFDSEVEDEVWMFCIDQAYYFGIPQSKSRHTEGRDSRIAEREGSLPPPIAAAMAFAGMPRNDDVICDPTCGSGTVLAEAHAYAREASLIGIDIDAKAIATARKNLTGIENLKLIQGDSRKLKLDQPKITLMLANFPFGVQFGERSENPKLYSEILSEMMRLKSDEAKWRGVILTSDTESLNEALSKHPKLKSEQLFRVKIRGELATAIRLS